MVDTDIGTRGGDWKEMYYFYYFNAYLLVYGHVPIIWSPPLLSDNSYFSEYSTTRPHLGRKNIVQKFFDIQYIMRHYGQYAILANLAYALFQFTKRC